MESFSGPFPPPAVLERYEALYPGATKQLFTMAEQQATHRQGLERIAIRGDARRANLGLACGFVVALAGLGVSGFLIYSGHEVGGTILGSIDFVGLVGVFVYGTESRRRERTAKAEIMANGYAHREGRAARLENRGDNPPR